MQVTTEVIGDAKVVSVEGQALDASNAKDFKASMAPLIVSGAKLVLDLGRLRFVDSSGLGAILSCLRQLNSMQGQLKLSGMAKPVRALFELVRMHRVFEIFNTSEEALRSFGVEAPEKQPAER